MKTFFVCGLVALACVCQGLALGEVAGIGAEARAAVAAQQEQDHLTVAWQDAAHAASQVAAYGWTATDKAVADSDSIRIIMALRQPGTHEQFETVLMSVSDPKSPAYGQYLSLDELAELAAPAPEATAAVADWLAAVGATDIQVSHHGEFVAASLSAAAAHAALPGTRLQHFSHAALPAGRTLLRSASGSMQLPAAVAGLLDTISGVTDFPSMQHLQSRRRRTVRLDMESVELSAAELQSQQQLGAAAPLLASASNGPLVNITLGGDTVVAIIMTPVCQSGRSAFPSNSAGDSLCSGDGSAIKAFDIQVTQPGTSAGGATTITATVGKAPGKGNVCACAANGMGSPCGCNVGATGLVNYVNATVQVRSLYADGSVSAWTSSNAATPAIPSAWVTVETIRRAYGIPEGTRGSGANGNSQAVIEFDAQYYSPSDLDMYNKLMSLPAADVTVHGTNNATQPGGEATLDVQMITGVAGGVPTHFWYSQGFLVDYLNEMSSEKNPPLVQSISYGEPETFMVPSTMHRVNLEFMKLGMRGVTVISTAGDLGVSDGAACDPFHADFPSSSPYTTSLGATSVARNTSLPICSVTAMGLPIMCQDSGEIPCALDAGAAFTTGGMFSGVFPAPGYQQTFVNNYLATAPLPPANLFNKTGRGYNDVAAFGNNILVVDNGAITVSGGTSASGPIFAGVVGLLNTVRLGNKQPSLGFLNPLLYETAASTPSAFNTIMVDGITNACGEHMCCEHGLPGSYSGWSPLAGLGSPVYNVLAQVVTAAATKTAVVQLQQP